MAGAGNGGPMWWEWPSRDALGHSDFTPLRQRLRHSGRLIALSAVVVVALTNEVPPWSADQLRTAGALVVLVGALLVIRRAALRQSPVLAGCAVAGIVAGTVLLHLTSTTTPVGVAVWVAMLFCVQCLPLAAALPTVASLAVLTALLDHRLIVGMLAGTVVAVLAGYAGRVEREGKAAILRQLAQQEAMLAAQAETAALTERTRIAREMHDVLAHTLSASAVQLEALRLLAERGAEPERLAAGIEQVRGLTVRGLTEASEAIGALRGEFAEPHRRVADLAEQAGARFAQSGEPVELTSPVALALVRTTQEALTNASKHAAGAPVSVSLEYTEDEVGLVVRNPLVRGARLGALAMSGSGHGLVGMRERAELAGGSLTAEPDGGEFVVTLRVPR